MSTRTHGTARGRADVRPTVIFDGDDTLWKTQYLYDRAKAGMAKLLAETASERAALIEEFDRFDARRAQQIGLTPRRFMESIEMFYAERRGFESEKLGSHFQKLRALASEVLQPPELFRDTVTSLKALEHACRLYLLTAGDKRVQREKLRHTGLSVFFQKIWIVRGKTPELFRRIARR